MLEDGVVFYLTHVQKNDWLVCQSTYYVLPDDMYITLNSTEFLTAPEQLSLVRFDLTAILSKEITMVFSCGKNEASLTHSLV